MGFGVLWDMDGTLVDSEPLHEQTLRLSLAREGVSPPDDLHERVCGMPAEQIHALFAGRHGLAAPFAEWSRFRCTHFVERAMELRAREGALELFRELQRRGVPQAIVSNSDRLLVDASLRAVGLAEPGLVTVSRNDVRDGKPDAEPYRRAAWLLGLDASQLSVVEDSVTGARAGLAAGMRTLFWPQVPMEGPAGAITLRHIDELRARLAGDRCGW